MLEYGQFFDGTRLRLSSEAVWKVSGSLTAEIDYELNRVELPAGDFPKPGRSSATARRPAAASASSVPSPRHVSASKRAP